MLYSQAHTFVPEDNKKFREALNSRNTNDIIITEGQIDCLSVAEAGYQNVVSVPNGAKGFTWYDHCSAWLDKFEEVIVFGDRIKLLNIVDDIIDNAEEVIEGKWKGQEGTILFYRKGEDLVLVRKNDNNFVSIFKGGANNGWFKDLGR